MLATARLAYGQYELYRKLIANALAIREEQDNDAENYQHFSVVPAPVGSYLSTEVTENMPQHQVKVNDGDPKPLSKLERLKEE